MTPIDDFKDNGKESPQISSWKRLYYIIVNLDPGGVLFHIATRSVFAGWLAFLLKMYTRRPFPNIMFFLVVMFTLYSLIESHNSIKSGITIAASLYSITGLCYFIVNVLHPFPTLILLFFAIFSFALIMICKLRILAVFPIGYATIFAASDRYGWLVGVNGCFSLLLCFACTIFVILIFPKAQTASVKSCIAKYFCELRTMFDRMSRGEQLEGEELFRYFHSHISLNLLIQKLTLDSGTRIFNMNISYIEQKTKQRFLKMHELSRGLILLRGFHGESRDIFLKEFPKTLDMIAEFNQSIIAMEQHILYNSSYDPKSADKFRQWSQYYTNRTTSPSSLHYQYAFSNLSLDLANAIDNNSDDNISKIQPEIPPLFSRTTKSWEALRFSLGMVISYIFFKATCMPHGEWIGTLVAFTYACPQHGLVFKRINKGLLGTCLGLILGFIFVETTMSYCYLWIYATPLILLIFIYMFLLKMDFGVLMIAFSFFLMISLIMSAPLDIDINFYQNLASRMVATIIAASIVFFLEIFSFHYGSIFNDISSNTSAIFKDIALSLKYCVKKISGTKVDIENLDRTSQILASYGNVAVMQSAIEFEIGYNPKMNEHYHDLLKHLHIAILYLKKMRYIARHNRTELSDDQRDIINKTLENSIEALKTSTNFGEISQSPLKQKNMELLKPLYCSDSGLNLKMFMDSFILFAGHVDSTQKYASKLTENTILFANRSEATNP